MGWTFVYSLLLELQPQSFAATNEVARNDYVGRILQLRYFSFMTLTTVGYSDIVPHSPAARTMTILEAGMGQFYLVALGRTPGWFAHRARERSTLARLIISPPKAQIAF
jgi:hypothetical protein